MIYKNQISTPREGFIDITSEINRAIKASGIKDGLCVVYCPHTTAGLTINENSDPDVLHDLSLGLRKAYPDRAEFKHFEGNSAAHLKASVMGSSVSIIIENGKPVLGVWQAVYFCEFDGPRNRNYYIKLIGS